MPSASDPFLWIFVLAVLLIFGPPLGWAAFRRFQESRRRKMVNSPRKIIVARGSDDPVVQDPCATGHQRSKSRAYTGPGGQVLSSCKKCGVRMRRMGPGSWEVYEKADSPE